MNLRFAPALFTALALSTSPAVARADPPKAPSLFEEAPTSAFRPLPSWAVYKTEFRSVGMMTTGIIGGIAGTIAMGVGTGIWASDPCGNIEEIPVDVGGAPFISQCQGSASQTTGMIITLTSAIVVAVAIPLIIVGSQRVRVPRAPRAKPKAAASSFGVSPGPSGLSFVF